MSGRERRESLRAHEDGLRLALSCVATPIVTTRAASRGDKHSFSVMLNHAEPVALRGQPVTLTIREDILLHPRIDRGRALWSSVIAAYAYTFRDRGRREILMFHWHPEGFSDITYPHIHIGAAMIAADAPVRPTDFHRAHIPTSHVFIDDVVRFAIAELGVEPLRPDWDTLLAGIARQRGQVT